MNVFLSASVEVEGTGGKVTAVLCVGARFVCGLGKNVCQWTGLSTVHMSNECHCSDCTVCIEAQIVFMQLCTMLIIYIFGIEYVTNKAKIKESTFYILCQGICTLYEPNTPKHIHFSASDSVFNQCSIQEHRIAAVWWGRPDRLKQFPFSCHRLQGHPRVLSHLNVLIERKKERCAHLPSVENRH